MFDPKQSTILVKKADGTFAKVPLSEFKKIQAATQKPVEPAKPATYHQPVVHNTKIHTPAPHHAVKHQAPVHIKSHTDHAKSVHHTKPPDSATASPGKMSRADASSPLEEKLKIKSSAPLFSPKREKQVEEVLGKLGFSVVPDVLGRLKSLVLAKLKDIKSEDETRELLARSIKNGGLGLTESQVEKIIKSCREVSASGGEVADVPVLKGKSGNMALMVEPPELPMIIDPTPTLPLKREGVVATPLFKEGQGEVKQSGDTQKQEVISKLVSSSMANESMFKLNTRPTAKQSMQDVTASSNEMGPIEEIKSITLTDFRRLSGNPEEAAKRLQQKMFNLQEESFVWYLDALAAYHNSPLYSEYMQAVCQSLAERKSLANILNIKNGIKLNEVMALIEMERAL